MFVHNNREEPQQLQLVPHRQSAAINNALYVVHKPHIPSSLATQACNPSGDIKVLGRWFCLSRPGPMWLFSGLPIPSWELGRGAWAKAWASWFLERRAPRKAGFTEQRSFSALGGGRITGRCHLDPSWPARQSRLNQHVFYAISTFRYF
ncbi:unnamed protein product [Malus baccata var. baccata]